VSVRTDLYSVLNNNSGVRAIVGISSSPQTSKIYADHVRAGVTVPYIVYSVSSQPISTLDGIGNLFRQSLNIRCYADTSDKADALANAVYSALEGNGYQSDRFPFYDDDTDIYSVIMEWAQIA